MSKQFWESRWQSKQIGWDLGKVSPPLKAYFDQLEDKNLKILIPGCGNAYEAEYLHKNAFSNVFIVEISEKAIKSFMTRYPEFPKSQIIQEDFFALQGTYDLIVEQTFFCAINPKLRRKYVQKMNDLLSSGGKLIGVLFNREFEGGPPFGGSSNDYKALFSDYFNIITMADCHNSVSPRQGSELFIILQKE